MRGLHVRRDVLGAMVFAVVLVFQSAYVRPSPVLADDCVPIGGGFVVCGGGGPVGGGPPLVVSGPEDNIIQGSSFDASDPLDKSAMAAWGWIEQEAKAYVAAIHSIDTDSRLNDWARGELRAYVLARLLQIAQKPAAERTADEQMAFHHLQKLVQAKKIGAAQNAVNQYNNWNANKCGYLWPSSVTTNVVEYAHRPGTLGLCGGVGGLFGSPSPPTADEFTAVGNAMVFASLAGNPDAARVSDDLARAGVFLGGLTAAAAAGAIAALLVGTLPALSSLFVTGGSLVIFPFAAFGAAGAAAGGAAAGAGALVAALGIASVVAVVVLFVVVTALAIWGLVTDAEVPINLNTILTDAQNNAPDLGAMAGTNDGVTFIAATFLEQTMPDYAERRTDSPAAHQTSDPDFLMVQHSPGPDTGLPNSATINPIDWAGVGHTAYLSRGWWVDDPAGGSPPTYALSIKYVDWAGQHWTASVAGETFIHTHEGVPGDTFLSPDIQYVGPGNVQYKATWHGNRRPTLAPVVSGTLTEGQTLSFQANASDPDASLPGGDPVTVKWLFEPTGFTGLVLLPGDGRSALDHCQNDPIGATFTPPGGGPAFATCPWPIVNGASPNVFYGDDGSFHVRVVATDSHGATAERNFVVPIANLKPVATVDAPATHSILEGQGVTVTGSFDDPGEDQVTVSIDWGDGTTTSQQYPCAPAIPPCTTIPMPPAADPTNWSIDHTYTDDPTGAATDYTITVTTTDDNGGTDSQTRTATVANVNPTMTINCGYVQPPNILVPECFFGGDIRFGHPGDDMTVRGLFVDPGSDAWTLQVDWGDGGPTEVFGYPCGSGACPFSTASFSPIFLAGPGITFWHLTHAYDAPGTYSIAFTVSDDDGGSVSGSASAKVNPSSVPTASITSPVSGGVYRVGQVVAADYSCTDDILVTSCVGPVADGANIDTTTVGTKTFTVQATDGESNTASASAQYRVVYPFRFVRPTLGAGHVNNRRAGVSTSVWFSLSGDFGLDVLNGLARSRPLDCSTWLPTGAPTAARQFHLAYHADVNRYVLVWRTNRSWAGTCREFIIRLDDGTRHTTRFHFRPIAPAP